MTSREHYFVYSKGILGLRTNVPDWKWSFGSGAPAATRSDYEGCRLRLSMTVAADADMPPAVRNGDSPGTYHYFTGTPGADVTQYDRRFLMHRRLRLEATGLLGESPAITVNRTYHRFVSHRFMNLHSDGYILTDVAALLLLRRGLAPLHCSAFRSRGSTVVVFAPPNCGKTLTTMTSCLKHGADFIAEDLAISDGRTVFAVPFTSTFRFYPQLIERRRSRIYHRIADVIPPLELIPRKRELRVDRFIEEARIAHSSPVTHVVVLQRGAVSGVTEVSADDLYRRLVNLNRYEFKYDKAPLVLAHEFLNPDLDVDHACSVERDVLRRLASTTTALVVTASDPNEYAALILGAVDDAHRSGFRVTGPAA